MGKKKKKSVKVVRRVPYSSFSEYIHVEVTVSALENCCQSLLFQIRKQFNNTSIDKKSLRSFVLMLEYVVAKTKERIMGSPCSEAEYGFIKGQARSKFKRAISSIQKVLEAKHANKKRLKKERAQRKMMEEEKKRELKDERRRNTRKRGEDEDRSRKEEEDERRRGGL